MARFAFLLSVFLLFSFQIQGSRPATPVFVQTGGDVLLDVVEVGGSEECDLVNWKFNKTILVRFLCSSGSQSKPSVEDPRIEFFTRNYTMKIKNLRESDSGIYTARKIGREEKMLAEYKVTVQDAVSPAELTVGSVLNSSTSCNLTVTCSTGPSKISSTVRCDTETCSQEGGEQPLITKHGDSLLVYLSNKSIICNHSNHVSWLNDTRHIQHLCPHLSGSGGISYLVWVIVGAVLFILIILIILIILVILVRLKREKKFSVNGDENTTENTVYASPAVEMAQVQDPGSTNEASPNTIYSALAGPSTENKPLPQSLYAAIEKSPKP
ncbi:SLAM family member 6-like [Cololabis saira]|uniref:SLAM family member 6-like n=1 Tax=Cololabis saira TaxID=129043 RepID=UPI002AD2C1AB|nr:SLAM family member 6-like [Cololabis saira]